jgi:plasmid stabilization system protein ParE
MPVDIHPAALDEDKSALAWYLERNQRAAENFVEEIERAVALVIQWLQRWPFGQHPTRRFVVQRFPFAVIYRERESGVQILAIAHGHRRPGYWKDRL